MNGDCSVCTGLCCRYFAVTINTPRDYDDYDEYWWALMHKPVEIHAEGVGTPDEEWTLRVHLKCEHLTGDNRCDAYHDRPNVCREYTTEECEMSDFEEDPADLWFETADEFRLYCRRIGVHLTGRRRGKTSRRRRTRKALVPFPI